LHTTSWAAATGREVGKYRVHYADGTAADISLVYGQNIVSWSDKRSTNGCERVWEGKFDGAKAALHRLEWTNPQPDKVIEGIEMVSTLTEAAPILVGLSGITSK